MGTLSPCPCKGFHPLTLYCFALVLSGFIEADNIRLRINPLNRSETEEGCLRVRLAELGRRE